MSAAETEHRMSLIPVRFFSSSNTTVQRSWAFTYWSVLAPGIPYISYEFPSAPTLGSIFLRPQPQKLDNNCGFGFAQRQKRPASTPQRYCSLPCGKLFPVQLYGHVLQENLEMLQKKRKLCRCSTLSLLFFLNYLLSKQEILQQPPPGDTSVT